MRNKHNEKNTHDFQKYLAVTNFTFNSIFNTLS